MRCLCFLLMMLAAFSISNRACGRIWTDKTGQYSVDATLIRVDAAAVHLRKTDGSVVVVPLIRLSQGDVDYVKALATKAATPPKAKPAAKAAPVENAPDAEIQKLLDTFADDAKASETRLAALAKLGDYGAKAKPALPMLQDLLLKSNPPAIKNPDDPAKRIRIQIHETVWEIFRKMGKPAVPALVETVGLLRNRKNWEFQKLAARSIYELGRMGPDAKEAESILLDAALPPDHADLTYVVGKDRYGERWEDWCCGRRSAHLGGLALKTNDISLAAQKALGNIGVDPNRAAPVMLRVLEQCNRNQQIDLTLAKTRGYRTFPHRVQEQRELALDLLETGDAIPPKAVDAFVDYLKLNGNSPGDAEFQSFVHRIIDLLAEMGPAAKKAEPVLRTMLAGPYQKKAEQALEKIRGD